MKRTRSKSLRLTARPFDAADDWCTRFLVEGATAVVFFHLLSAQAITCSDVSQPNSPHRSSSSRIFSLFATILINSPPTLVKFRYPNFLLDLEANTRLLSNASPFLGFSTKKSSVSVVDGSQWGLLGIACSVPSTKNIWRRDKILATRFTKTPTVVRESSLSNFLASTTHNSLLVIKSIRLDGAQCMPMTRCAVTCLMQTTLANNGRQGTTGSRRLLLVWNDHKSANSSASSSWGSTIHGFSGHLLGEALIPTGACLFFARRSFDCSPC